MNERIRELMGNTLDEKFAGTWSTMDMQDLTKFSERFAELIVRECGKQVQHVYKQGGGTLEETIFAHFNLCSQ